MGYDDEGSWCEWGDQNPETVLWVLLELVPTDLATREPPQPAAFLSTPSPLPLKMERCRLLRGQVTR